MRVLIFGMTENPGGVESFIINYVLVNNCVGFSLSPFYGTQKVIAYDYPMKCEVIIT